MTSHWHQQHYPPVSLNSPPLPTVILSSTLTSSPSTLSSTSSSHSTCSTQPSQSQSPSRARRYTTHFAPATRPPATPHSATSPTASTSLRPPAPPQVLSSPDPTTAVRTERRSVRFAKVPGGVNWARPLGPSDQPRSDCHNHNFVPNVPPVPPSAYSNMHFAQIRRPSTASSSVRTPSSSASSSSLDDSPLPETPPTIMSLPPGASEAEPRAWAVAGPNNLKGLGISLPPVQTAPARARDDDAASRTSSDAGSLAGESTATASTGSSSPPTPTRLLFVSEQIDSLSKPTTLSDLTRLRAAAAQLDQESKRLRRHRGRDPAATRAVPRKAVPALTDADMVAPPKPRRPAVRHSLLMPPTNTAYSFLVEAPVHETPGVTAATATSPSPTRRTFGISPSSSPASKARRHAFYAQGKAAQSVIEFSSRTKDDAPSAFPPPFLRSRHASGAAIPTTSSGTTSRGPTPASPTVPGPPVMAAPLPVPCAAAPPPPPTVVPEAARSQIFLPTPDAPRTITAKPSNSFLNKHKKLSRFLGKSPVVV